MQVFKNEIADKLYTFQLWKNIDVCYTKGPRFSEKDWYYLQAQTDMPFHYLKLVV